MDRQMAYATSQPLSTHPDPRPDQSREWRSAATRCTRRTRTRTTMTRSWPCTTSSGSRSSSLYTWCLGRRVSLGAFCPIVTIHFFFLNLLLTELWLLPLSDVLTLSAPLLSLHTPQPCIVLTINTDRLRHTLDIRGFRIWEVATNIIGSIICNIKASTSKMHIKTERKEVSLHDELSIVQHSLNISTNLLEATWISQKM